MENNNLDLILKPISEENPTGEDSKYEYCYEIMELEIKKFGSLFGETVEWSIVEEHAYEVLTIHSKDLKALSYYIRSLLEKRELIGLKQGFTLLKEMLSIFGCNLYPQRKRARDGSVNWLITQLEAVLPKLDINNIDNSDASFCIILISEIDDLYRNVFPDSDINFKIINTILQRVSVSENTTPSIERKSIISIGNSQEIKSKTVRSLDKSITTRQNEIDIDTDFSSPSASKNTLKKVAEFMMYSNIETSLAYRLNRYCTWCDMDEIPAHDNENKTELSLPVSQDKQTEYREQTKKETEESTIKQLEKILINAPFWLTGHYFMFSMLENLNCHEAAEAVRQETQQFITRLNGIERLTFSNKIPFADEDTLNWLSTKTSTALGSSSYLDCDEIINEDVTLDSLGEYVAQISSLLDIEISGRNQWMLYTKLIKGYQKTGLHPLCIPYLEKMWNIKEEISLMAWEPDTCKEFNLLLNQIFIKVYHSIDNVPKKYKCWLSNSEL